MLVALRKAVSGTFRIALYQPRWLAQLSSLYRGQTAAADLTVGGGFVLASKPRRFTTFAVFWALAAMPSTPTSARWLDLMGGEQVRVGPAEIA